jgi:hypothetical protein
MASPTKKPVRKRTAKKPAKRTVRSGAGMSDAAVKARTGKDWAQWFALLDKAGAAKMAHREIANLLHARHKVGDWWSQMVTVAYERARGMRKLHETAQGFSASVSKTLGASADAIYAKWEDTRTRAGFLKQAVEFSTANPAKNLRFKWTDGDSRVEVRFYPKGKDKTQLVVDHKQLGSSAEVQKLKKFWKNAIEELQKSVKGASE